MNHGDKERLFLALVKDMAERINAQTLEALEPTMRLGTMPAPEAVKRASSEGVATFLRAYAVERGAGPG